MSRPTSILSAPHRLGGAGDPLTAIPALRALDAEVDAELRAAVAEARARGASWRDIAERLNVSRQSAWERYRS